MRKKNKKAEGKRMGKRRGERQEKKQAKEKKVWEKEGKIRKNHVGGKWQKKKLGKRG